MGLSSKVVSSNEGFGLDNWRSCNQSHHQVDDPPMPPPRSGPVRRQPQQSHSQILSDPLKCPRCDSMNTKFCYYNNYNKSQPRHFCKSCKRHWTKGGTLRNVPVGGGRKNKRQKITTSPAATSTTATAATQPGTKSIVMDNGIFLGSLDRNYSNHDYMISLPPTNSDHYDILGHIQLPLSGSSLYGCSGRGFIKSSGMEDSKITSVVPTTPLTCNGGGGFASELGAPAATLWSWDDIEALISTTTTTQGLTWDGQYSSEIKLP